MFIGATKKVYRHEKPFLQLLSFIHWFACPKGKIPKPVAPQSELRRLGGFELQLQLVRNQGDELRICGLALGVGHGVAEKALQGIQIAPVPGDFDGVANGPLHPAGGGLEGFGHLGVEDLGDGVRVPDGPRRDYQEPSKRERDRQRLIAFFIALFATASQGLTI